MANARKIALKALLEVRSMGAYSNITLNKLLNDSELSDYDKSFTTALFYGVLDRTLTLDHVLSKHIKSPLKKVSPFVLENLRLALFQIMFMDKIPESAAVNEAVKIVKASKQKNLSGFVNGVLRNILREGATLPDGDGVNDLSVRYSCPQWIVSSLLTDYGLENTKKFLDHSLLAPKVILRVNTLKTDAESLISELLNLKIPAKKGLVENSVIIDGGIDVSHNGLYKNGLFHIQDSASQTAVRALSPKRNERVLDLCSAPGGKAFTMAQYMENSGEIIACDIYCHRVELINNGAKRLGLEIIKPVVNNACVYNANLGTFDAVLCDVPCSGIGVIRRKPEIKYKSLEEYNDITQIQEQILDNADLYLKENGRILYSTCTVRKCENDFVVQRFLDKHPYYELKYQHTFMPHIDGTDGFYCALLQKSR